MFCRNHQCLVRTMNGTIETWYVQCMGTIETWWNIIHTVHWFNKNMVHTVFEHDRNMQGTKYEADIQPKLTIAFILSRCLYMYCNYADILDVISVCLHFSDEAFLSIQFLHLIHIALISRFHRWLDREAWNTCIIPNGH